MNHEARHKNSRALITAACMIVTLAVLPKLQAQTLVRTSNETDTPNKALTYNREAVLLFKRADFSHAIELLKKAIDLDPDPATAYSNMGATLNALGRYQEACSFLQRALRIQPDLVEAYCNMGYAYLKLSEYQKALTSYEKA